MTRSEAEAGKYQVPLEVYERLAKATPEEKTDIVLRLIEEHLEGRLELPEREGMRADLFLANLQDTYLSGANLQGASLFDADLEGAELNSANLQDAYLSGANLQGAHMFSTDLRGADLGLANLQGADLRLSNLQDAGLAFTNLQGANLWCANLRYTGLADTNLQDTYLSGANLQGANLLDVNLQGANLIGARLQGVDLSHCNITHIYISGAWLDRTRLRWEDLGGAIGEELDAENEQQDPEERAFNYGQAKHGYLALKQNFDDLGDYDAASWAYRKERRMEKLEALQKARTAVTERKWWAAAANCAKFASDQLVEWMCDYGESVPRVLGSLLVVYGLFTLFYGLTWSVTRVYNTPTAIVREPTRNLVDLMRFSLGAMTTLESAGLEPRNGLVELVAGLQALLGIALTGLLGFVVANRIRRS